MKTEIRISLAHRLLSPRPACLLTTRYKGQVNVMTIAWVCPVSLEPPLVMLAIHPSRYTFGLLEQSEECVINIPGRALAEQTLQCGRTSGAHTDKIELTRLLLTNGRRVEAPWIAECLAHIECALVHTYQPGDHMLFIGEIVGAWVEEEAFGETWLAPEGSEEASPLLHLGARDLALIGKKVTLP